MELCRWAFISLIAAGLMAGGAVAKIAPESIVGVWLFDEGAGDVAKDYSGNGHDGKLEGGPKWVEGVFGKALEFDGVDDCVIVPPFENPTKAVTVTAWVKSSTPTWNTWGWVLSKRNAFILHPNQGTKNMSWCVFIDNNWNTPNGWRAGEIGPDDITKWHMYTATFDSSTGEWKLYIDGELKSTLSCNKAEINLDTGHMTIGRDDDECPGRYGQGVIDEVALFSVALSEDEIKEIMTKGLGVALGITPVSPKGRLAVTWGEVKSE